jgi:3-hydroxypropanoate dehydrogenase
MAGSTSDDAKAKLAEAASDGNKDKIKAAPVTAIIGMDLDFHEQLPWLFPHADAKSWFEGDEDGRTEAAMRNSSMQGGYFIIAARALGLDCGPMSGFDADAVNDTFFADDLRVRVNFICSVGYGDAESIFDRSPRPEFGKFNSIV